MPSSATTSAGRILAAARDGVGPACLSLLEDPATADLGQALGSGSLTNLLSNPMPLFAEDLTVTALKLLHRDIFGLEKYLAWGVVPRVRTVVAGAGRGEPLHCPRRRRVGPRSAAGPARVADRRRAPVQRLHRPSGGGVLRYACDGRYLALEVSDGAGALERATIMRSLSKAVTRGPGKVDMAGRGAGIGLATVYAACNHLVFNVAPGRRTEIIALIDEVSACRTWQHGPLVRHILGPGPMNDGSARHESFQALRRGMIRRRRTSSRCAVRSTTSIWRRSASRCTCR